MMRVAFGYLPKGGVDFLPLSAFEAGERYVVQLGIRLASAGTFRDDTIKN